MKIQKIQFKNGRGETLRGYLHKPRKFETAIILLHGFPGDCEGKKFKRLSQVFSALGNLVLRFNFNGTPNSDGKFENKLMSKEVEDIKYAIDFVSKYSPKKVVLVGFSTGAIDLSLYAHKDKRIAGIVLVGSVADLKKCVHYDFTDAQINEFKKKGFIIYTSHPESWTYKKKLNKKFYDEFFKLNIKKELKKYHKPLLIIHGEKDPVVPLSNAKELYRSANNPKKLIIIKNGDHGMKKTIPKIKLILEINKFIKEIKCSP